MKYETANVEKPFGNSLDAEALLNNQRVCFGGRQIISDR